MPAFTPDEMLVTHGFKVEIETGAGGADVDASWESVSGGERMTSPGHQSVGEITLRGAVTDGRKAIETWINESAAGRPFPRTVSITPVDQQGNAGPTYRFFDCELSAYLPPLLRRDPCGPTLREEVRFVYKDWTVLG
jgi:hypothetical protein